MKTYKDRDVGEKYALSQVSAPSREEDLYTPKHLLSKCYCCSHESYIKIPYFIYSGSKWLLYTEGFKRSVNKITKIKKTLGSVQYNIRHQVTKNIITVLGL